MNWDAISAIAELLGSLAVIVTLVYLTVQLKQQNTVTKAQIEQQRADSVTQVTSVLGVVENRNLLTKVMLDKSLTPADLSEEENVHLNLILSPLRANLDNNYRQFQSGYISKEVYEDVSRKLFSKFGHLFVRFEMPLTRGFRAELIKIMEEDVTE